MWAYREHRRGAAFSNKVVTPRRWPLCGLGSGTAIVPFVYSFLFDSGPAARWRWRMRRSDQAGCLPPTSAATWPTLVGYGESLMDGSAPKRHPANKVAPFSLGVPVKGLAAGMIVLGRGHHAVKWGGIALHWYYAGGIA
jgi:O-acetylserine/cysteine efflux transporter